MAKNFLRLDERPQLQWIQRELINMQRRKRPIPRLIITKPRNIKDKEDILKAPREKGQIPTKRRAADRH
jgi:hypothetical protein